MAKITSENNGLAIPDEVVINKIYLIRAQKVMLDSDLAEPYGVETRRLKEQVRRNLIRFPEHFMFELTRDEFNQILRSQNATLGHGTYSKYLPFASIRYLCYLGGSTLLSDCPQQIDRT